MTRDKRQKRDLHALDKDEMVFCNPRDKEASLRAQTKGIATDVWEKVTCRKCLLLIYKHNKAKETASKADQQPDSTRPQL